MHLPDVDALAAVLAGRETMYSEDLPHNQVFEERIRVVNPFTT
jgi:predicted nucleic acid-binding protein